LTADRITAFDASGLPPGWVGIAGEHARDGTTFASLGVSDGKRAKTLPLSAGAWTVLAAWAWAQASAPAAPPERQFLPDISDDDEASEAAQRTKEGH
jgi:hypothetical protein